MCIRDRSNKGRSLYRRKVHFFLWSGWTSFGITRVNPLLKHFIIEREKRSSFPVFVRKAASLTYTISSEKLYRYLIPPGRVFLFTGKWLFFLNLQRTKNTVASIPQARHDITAVSYTHLDVYKRQPMEWSRTIALKRLLSFQNHFYITIRKSICQFHFIDKGTILQNKIAFLSLTYWNFSVSFHYPINCTAWFRNKPVSYTHLLWSISREAPFMRRMPTRCSAVINVL